MFENLENKDAVIWQNLEEKKMNQAKEENLEKPTFRSEMGWSH